MRSSKAATMPSPSSKSRSKSSSRATSQSKPSHGTPRSGNTQSSGIARNPPRRHNSMSHIHDSSSQYSRQQSRNTSPSQRSPQVAFKQPLTTPRRAHFETMSDTASAASSSTSPSGGRTVASEGGGTHPALSFRLTSPGTKSTLSNASSGILRKKDKIASVKKAIEGMLGYRNLYSTRFSILFHSNSFSQYTL